MNVADAGYAVCKEAQLNLNVPIWDMEVSYQQELCIPVTGIDGGEEPVCVSQFTHELAVGITEDLGRTFMWRHRVEQRCASHR